MRWAEECFQGWPAIQVPGNHEFYHHDIVLIARRETAECDAWALRRDLDSALRRLFRRPPQAEGPAARQEGERP